MSRKRDKLRQERIRHPLIEVHTPDPPFSMVWPEFTRPHPRKLYLASMDIGTGPDRSITMHYYHKGIE